MLAEMDAASMSCSDFTAFSSRWMLATALLRVAVRKSSTDALGPGTMELLEPATLRRGLCAGDATALLLLSHAAPCDGDDVDSEARDCRGCADRLGDGMLMMDDVRRTS